MLAAFFPSTVVRKENVEVNKILFAVKSVEFGNIFI